MNVGLLPTRINKQFGLIGSNPSKEMSNYEHETYGRIKRQTGIIELKCIPNVRSIFTLTNYN